MKLNFMSRIYSGVARYTVKRMGQDLEYAMQVRARDASAVYAAAMMSDAKRFIDRDSLLLYAAERAKKVSGCVCEFGVFSGYTLRLLADVLPEKPVYGFDSFEGLPVDWRPGFGKGAFKTPIPKFKQDNISLRIGWFDKTVPAFVQELLEAERKISFLHIDCDLYVSTKCVFEGLLDLCSPGAVIVFDEYFNYPGWEEHEHRALMEAVERGATVSYLGFNSQGEQVLCEVGTAGGVVDPVLAREVLR